ncbi:uncharacterized protein LOC124890295 [Capsicum annuum]|uniref:uncharacterized protein LOC107850931 n=1 Tax=Capsicum annuum TaxID=4072 RepID=UPI0007BEF86D|nr:uncharacterized protein LOC107850931 [Capsicum annuum]XP_047258115.1 uncharacterized protein LOC124890295 [Capsicum annuum]
MAEQKEANRLTALARAQVNVQNVRQHAQHPNPEDEYLGDEELLNPGNPRRAERIAVQEAATTSSRKMSMENMIEKLLKRVEATDSGVTTMKTDLTSISQLKKKAEDAKFRKFLTMLNQLAINVPLVEAFEQIPRYAKFMKDLMTKKWKVIHEPEDNLIHCGAISTRSLVPKKADPGAFTILCTISSLKFTKALCDLGDSINLMPLYVNKKLGLENLTPTNMQLMMAERSMKQPVGILHDVLVKVDDFTLPADFVVLDCEVVFKVPIILGRAFIATRSVIVDMELNELKFRQNDKEARFEINSSMTQQKKMGVWSIIDMFYKDDKRVSTGYLGEV